MQRLFSTFPNSWPGTGLLLLRFCAALSLMTESVGAVSNAASPLAFWIALASIVLGTLLLVGFCTPIAAVGQVIIETWLLLSALRFSTIAAVSALVGMSLIMLGPGAWSIDSRLFGRRRIDLPRD
jgi:putative oxidoreductase